MRVSSVAAAGFRFGTGAAIGAVGRRATGLGAAASSPSEEVEEPSLEGSFFGGGGTACRFVGGGTGAVAGVLRLAELVGSFFFAGVKVQRT